MNNSSLAYEYINDIPWERDPVFEDASMGTRYLNAFNLIFNNINPSDGQRINFNDDFWNFRSYFPERADRNTLHFDFSDFLEEEREYLKFWIIFMISERKSISTIKTRFNDFKSVVGRIFKETNQSSILTITDEEIEEFVEKTNLKPTTRHKYYYCSALILGYIQDNYRIKLPIDIDHLWELNEKYSRQATQQGEKNRLPNIPEEYFRTIVAKCRKIMSARKTPTEDKITAASIIILSQLGFRMSDLSILRTSQLHSMELEHIKKQAYFITYNSIKPSKVDNPLLSFDIFCNDLAYKAWKIIEKNRLLACPEDETDYLIRYSGFHLGKGCIQEYQYNKRYTTFFKTYLEKDCSKKWPGIKKKKVDDKYYYIPHPHQFRVHVISYLYNNAVPIEYIQKFMGHLVEASTYSYVRPTGQFQENPEYTEIVIDELLNEDANLLGNGTLGAEIKQNILDFVEKGKYNIATDIHQIVMDLRDNAIIRAKENGVCVKTSFVKCKNDEKSNIVMCAYDICPNLFHFYYMADVTYINFHTLQETLIANQQKGKIRAAQFEYNKMMQLLDNKLIPELNELDSEIARKGEEHIITRHPSLIDIVNHRKEIRQEISVWKNRKRPE